MAVIINASTSTGLVQSADTSGIIQFQSNGSTKATLNSSGFSYPGGVLQVVQTQKTNSFSTSSSSFVDITGFSVSITPSSASNKILVTVMIQASSNSAGWFGSRIRLVRNGTAIALGDADGSRVRATFDFSFNTSSASLITPMPMVWLDSPSSTSAVTYKCDMQSLQGTTAFINKSSYDNGSDVYDTDVVSTITAMEIAA